MADRTDKLHARLQADPTDADAFRLLEEHYFHAKSWPDLVKLYVQRANSMNSSAKAAKLLAKAADICVRRLKKIDKATELLERAYKRDRTDPKLKNTLVEMWREAGEHGKVAEMMQAEMQLAPAAQRPQIAMEVADAWRKAGAPAQALGVLEQCIAEAPGAVGLHAALVEALETMDAGPELLDRYEGWAEALRNAEIPEAGKQRALAGVWRRAATHAAESLKSHEKALEYWKRARAHAPSNREMLQALIAAARACDDVEALVEGLETEAELEGNTPRAAELHLQVGTLLQDRLSRPEMAAEHFELAFKLDESGQAGSQLEAVFRAQGRLGELADLHARRAVVTDNPQVAVESLRAEAELRQGPVNDPVGALAAWESLLAVQPTAVEAWQERLRLLDELGHHAELVQALVSEADQTDPVTAMPLLQRAGAVAEGRLEDPARAAQIYRMLLALDPDSREAAESLARAASQAGDRDGVIAALEAQLPDKTGPAERAPLLSQLGVALASRADRLDDAIERLEEALALVPADAQAMDALSRCYFNAERWEDLVGLYRKLLALNDDPATQAAIYAKIGELSRHKLDDAAAAEVAFREVLRCRPEAREAWTGLREIALDRGDSAAAVDAARREAEHAPAAERSALLVEAGVLATERLNNDELASGLFADVLAAEPAHADARERLVGIHLRCGRKREAAAVLTGGAGAVADAGEAIALARRAADLLRAEDDLEGAARALEAGLSRDPDAENAGQVRDDLAHIYNKLGRYDDVVRLHLAEADRETDATRRAGQLREAAEVLYRRAGDPERAARILRSVTELAPRDGSAWRLLGETATAAQNHGAVVEAVRGERATDPGPARSLELWQIEARACTEHLGRYDEAIAAWRAVILAGADDVSVEIEALDHLLEIARRRSDGAAIADAALARAQHSPGETGVPLLREAVEASVEDSARALRAVRDWVSRTPQDLDALQAMARVARQADDPVIEADALGLVAEHAPEPELRASALRRRATLLSANGRPLEAAEALRALLDLKPDRETREEAVRLFGVLGDSAAVERVLREWSADEPERDERLPVMRRLLDTLLAQPDAAAAAEQVAREVLELAPADPATVRACTDLCLARGDVSAAVEVLSAAAAAGSDHLRGGLLRRAAELLEARGEAGDARLAAELLEELLRVDASDGRAREARARIAAAAGEWAVARSHRSALLDAAEEPADRVAAALALGRLCESDDDATAAIAAYAAGRAADPAAPAPRTAMERLYERLGRHEDLRALLEDEAGSGRGRPLERAAMWMRAARMAETAGDHRAAVGAYAAALDAAPDWAPAARGLRRAARAAGDDDLRLAATEAEARLTPDGPGRARLLAAAGLDRLRRANAGGKPTGDRKAAREALEEAFRLGTTSADALGALRELRRSNDDLAGAVAAGRAEADRRAGAARVQVLLEIAQLARGTDDVEGARRFLIEAIETAPSDDAPLRELVELERSTGDTARLADALGRSAERGGDAAAAMWREAAEAATSAGANDDAVQHWAAALEMEPSGPHAPHALAAWDALLVELGREAERPDLLARRAAVAGGGKAAAACWLERAELLLRIRPEEAAASFRAAAACDPDDPEPWTRLFELAEAQEDPAAAAEAARRLVDRVVGADAKQLALRLADHCETLGDLRGATDAVRRALTTAGADERIALHQRVIDLTDRFRDPGLSAETCEAAAAACDAPGEAESAAEWLARAARTRRDALGQDDAALDLLAHAVERAPKHRGVLGEYASALRAVGRTPEAADAMRRQRDLAPVGEHPAIERERGRLLLHELGDADAAADALTLARTAAPDDEQLRLDWQQALEQANRWAELADALEDELQTELAEPRAREARKLFVGVLVDALEDAPRAITTAEAIVADDGADAQAVAWAANALAAADRVEAAAAAHLQLRERLSDPAARAAEAVRAGDLWRGADRATDARAAFEAALADVPGHVAALHAVADLAEAAADWPAVAQACEQLVESASGADAPTVQAAALTRLGAVQARGLKDHPAARLSYERALALEPERADARAALVHTLEHLTEFDAVLALFESDPARARGGADAAAVLAREGALLAGALQDGKGAESRFRDALARDPDCLPALRGLRDVLGARVDPPVDELADLWERVARVGNAAARAGALTQAAGLRAAGGDDARAASSYAEALEVDPMHAGALAGLSRLCARGGDWSAASDVAARWEDALGAAGPAADRAEAAWIRGRAGEETGESPGVVASHFARAVAADGGHPEARRGLGESLTLAGRFGEAVPVLQTVLEHAARERDTAGLDRAGRFLARARFGAGAAAPAAAAWRGVLEAAGGPDAEASAGLARAEAAQKHHAVAAVAWSDAAGAADNPADQLASLIESAAEFERAGDPERAMAQASAACDVGGLEARPARERWMRLAMKAHDWATVRAQVGPLCEAAPGAEPRAAIPWIQLAAAAENRGGDPAAALAFHRRAFEADPAQLKSLEAGAKLVESADGADAATEHLEAGLLLHEAAEPTGGTALRLKLAERHRVAKRADRAADHLRAVLKQRPDDANAHVALARVLAARRSTLPEAAAQHQWLLEREPLRVASLRALEKIFAATPDPRRSALAGQAALAAEGGAVDDGAVLEPGGTLSARALDDAAVDLLLTGDPGTLLAIVAPALYKVHRPDLEGVAGRREQPPSGFARVERLAAKVAALLDAPDALQVAWAPGVLDALRLEPASPPTLLVGPSALTLHEGVLRFLIGRAVFLASRGWTLVDVLERRSGIAAVEGLIRDTLAGYVESVAPGDAALVKKVRGAVARRQRKNVEELCEAVSGAMDGEPADLAAALSTALGESGVRVGLIANGGDVGAAIQALAMDHKATDLPGLAAVWPPASEIARFPVSDPFARITEPFTAMDGSDDVPSADPDDAATSGDL